MSSLFPTDKATEYPLDTHTTMIVPGGMRVPADYPYVVTGDYLIDKCEAAWSTLEGDGLPFDFRLVGPPGVGKNATVYALAARTGKPLYMILGHEELTAEDLVVLATLQRDGDVQYIASPLLAAMLNGGICFIDEIAKMRPRALAPLSSVLDERRSITSALVARTFTAHEDFRFCAAYNPTDADAFDLAPWLRRRTIPELTVSPPDYATLEKIIRAHISDAMSYWPDVKDRLTERNLGKEPELDAGTVIKLLTYVGRLDAFANDNDLALGDVISVAIDHVIGRANKDGSEH